MHKIIFVVTISLAFIIACGQILVADPFLIITTLIWLLLHTGDLQGADYVSVVLSMCTGCTAVTHSIYELRYFLLL